jgi:HD-GYP domain-containing protein (c-di-GMP phosphodiesterase class II)
MRRISAKYAKPGMILGAIVYDNYGTMLLNSFIKLNQNHLKLLQDNKVNEILLDDWRVADVPVQSMFSPELEGKTANALRTFMMKCNGNQATAAQYIEKVSVAVNAMVRELAFEAIGEVNVTSCISHEDYYYIQPVKTVIISLAIGHRIGFSRTELSRLGLAAALKDIGYITIPPETREKSTNLTKEEMAMISRHPITGYEILSQHEITKGEIATSVLQHHERWNGTGYPYRTGGAKLTRFAQIISVADTFCTLLSEKPGRRRYMPHEAIEYIMAYSGDYFSPEVVEHFVRQVPCYASGLTIQLNTGEVCIVSNPNLGFVARPIVRICFDPEQGVVQKPYDINLAKAEFQQKLITKVLDYY